MTKSRQEIEKYLYKLNDIGATLFNQKKSNEAKNYINEAYKYIETEDITNPYLIIPITLNKVSLEREFKNFNFAKNILGKLIDKIEELNLEKFSKIEDKNFIVDRLLNSKILLATLYSDLKKYSKSIAKFDECIDFYNKHSSSGISSNTVATLYNNGAMTYSFIGNYAKALKLYELSLSLYEKDKTNINYSFFKADTLNNMGVIYQKLKKYRKAEKIFLEAIELHSKEYYKAMVLTNLGNMYREEKKHPLSLNCHKQALDIRNKISSGNPIYIHLYAESLNNYGNILLDSGLADEALSILLESIIIWTKLYKETPQKYGENIAYTSVNIGNCYQALNDFDKAKGYYTSALKFYKENIHLNKIEYTSLISGILCNLGCLEMDSGNTNTAEGYFKELLKLVSEIKELLDDNNKKYLYIFKAKIEEAIKGLMEIYSEDGNKLLSLIESKRNEHFIFNHELDLTNTLSQLKDEIMLTIELTSKYCFFIVSDKQKNQLYKIESELIVKNCNEMLNLVHLICYEQIKLTEKELYDRIISIGQKIFFTLPKEIQKIVKSENEIYLSLDRSFINFPFEFIVDDNSEFIGLKHLLPRISGIFMLNDILSSSPVVDFQQAKIIISDPEKDLKYSRKECAEIIAILDKYGSTVKLAKKRAIKTEIMKNLNKNLALFHFSGHGDEPDKLRMAYGEPIDCESLTMKKFNNNPLIFLNSCLSGTCEYLGGGHFLGMPMILFKNGAGSIISSTYPIFDEHAKIFSVDFYEYFSKGFSAGEAVIKARKNKKYPWEWGLHIFYGNPKLTIQ